MGNDLNRPNVHKIAWSILKSKVQTKTAWGKNELLTAMAEALEQAVEEAGV